MYREARIIISVKEPSRQDLWLHYRGTDLVLEKFESGWVPIGTVDKGFLTKDEADELYASVSTIDTLATKTELATKLSISTYNSEKANFATTTALNSGLAGKEDKGTAYSKEESDNRYVAKDGNKGLSTNDYTTAEKNKVAKIIIDGTGTKVLADNGSYIEASTSPTVQEVDEAEVTLAVAANTIYTCTTPVTSMTISSVANSTDLSIIKFNTGDTDPQFSYPEGTKTTGYKALVANASYSIFVFAGELTIVRYGE